MTDCAKSYLARSGCEDVTVTGPQDPTYDISRLFSNSSKIWKYTETSATIVADYANPKTIDFFAMAGLYLPAGSTIELLGESGGVQTSLAIINTSDCGEACECDQGYTVYSKFDAVTFSRYVINITTTGDVISALRVILDKCLPIEVSDGWSIQAVDKLGQPRRAITGARKANCGPVWRELSLNADFLTYEQFNTLFASNICKGYSQEYIFVIVPGQSCDPTVFLGAPKELTSFRRNARFGRFSKQFVLEEVNVFAPPRAAPPLSCPIGSPFTRTGIEGTTINVDRIPPVTSGTLINVTGAPAGVSFNFIPSSGEVEISGTWPAASTAAVTLTYSDMKVNPTTCDVIVNIESVVLAVCPLLSLSNYTGDKQPGEGDPVIYTPQFTSAGQGALSYSWAYGAVESGFTQGFDPVGNTFNPLTGVFNGTLNQISTGDKTGEIVVTVTDSCPDGAQTDSFTFTVQIESD